VPPDYDPLVAKILALAPDRETAIDRLRRALDETLITGIQTTLPFHHALVRDDAFRDARLSTDWVAERWDGPGSRARARRVAAVAAGLAHLEGETRADGDPPAPEDSAVRAPWRSAARRSAVDRWPR
jgi:acetyl/propionyl-CoA carboxylase alpha subunit